MGFLLRYGVEGLGRLSVDPDGVLTTLSSAEGDQVRVVHGDRLPVGAGTPPIGAAVSDLLAFTGGAFARHCGVGTTDTSAVLWTDHGATCPLHYARDADGNLLVATAAASLLPMLPGPVRLHAPGPRRGQSGFAGIAAVPPGMLVTVPLRVRPGAEEPAEFQHHFRLPEPAHPVRSWPDPEKAVAAVGRALADAVTRSLAGASSTGVLLSGGVDSSTVAGLTARHVGPGGLRTYTVGTPFGDEFEAARRLARHLGSEHEELMFTPADLSNLLPRMIRLLETWDRTTLQILAPVCFLLYRLAGREKLLLTGYGADLLFAGLGGAGSEEQTETALRDGVAATGYSNEFSPAFAAASGITVRHPYWAADMISTALSIPVSLKLRDGTVKWVLRQAAAEVIPADVAMRPKLGIHEGTAMHRMFAAALEDDDPAAQGARLREIAESVFSAGGGEDQGTARAGRNRIEPEGEGVHAGLAGVAS